MGVVVVELLAMLAEKLSERRIQRESECEAKSEQTQRQLDRDAATLQRHIRGSVLPRMSDGEHGGLLTRAELEDRVQTMNSDLDKEVK